MFDYVHIQQSLNCITIYKDLSDVKNALQKWGAFFMQQLFSLKDQHLQSRLP